MFDFDTIDGLIHRGRYDTALDLVDKEIKKQEDSIVRYDEYYFELLSKKIEVLYYKGSVDATIALCETVLIEKPSDYNALYYKARILKDTGKFEESDICYNKLADDYGDCEWAWSEKAEVDLINRDFYAAYKSYIRALDLFLSENDAFNTSNLWCIEENFKAYTHLYCNCLSAAKQYVDILLSNGKKEEAKSFYKQEYKYDIISSEHSNLMHKIYWYLDEDLEDVDGFTEMKNLYLKSQRQFEHTTEQL